jgi:SAM-dependent methyltransferase
MKPDELIRLYDAEYAASYDHTFLERFPHDADTRHELELIRSMLAPGASWLDVACGTGYFLSRFPDVDRAGLDLSPAMLELARERNPGIDIRRHNFLKPLPEWNDRFDLVSSMWYAYGMVDSVDEISQLIANLAAWTAPTGTCFIPVADPNLVAQIELPERRPYGPVVESPGEITITGIMWSLFEEKGKAHRHMISPSVWWMRDELALHFEDVETIRCRARCSVTTSVCPPISGRRRLGGRTCACSTCQRIL